MVLHVLRLQQAVYLQSSVGVFHVHGAGEHFSSHRAANAVSETSICLWVRLCRRHTRLPKGNKQRPPTNSRMILTPSVPYRSSTVRNMDSIRYGAAALALNIEVIRYGLYYGFACRPLVTSRQTEFIKLSATFSSAQQTGNMAAFIGTGTGAQPVAARIECPSIVSKRTKPSLAKAAFWVQQLKLSKSLKIRFYRRLR